MGVTTCMYCSAISGWRRIVCGVYYCYGYENLYRAELILMLYLSILRLPVMVIREITGRRSVSRARLNMLLGGVGISHVNSLRDS